MSNKPDDTLRDRGLKAAIWGQNIETRNGGENRIYNVNISRSYKDKNGDWQESSQFSADDLLRVSHLTERAYDRVQELRNEWLETRTDEKGGGRSRDRDR